MLDMQTCAPRVVLLREAGIKWRLYATEVAKVCRLMATVETAPAGSLSKRVAAIAATLPLTWTSVAEGIMDEWGIEPMINDKAEDEQRAPAAVKRKLDKYMTDKVKPVINERERRWQEEQ